MLSGKNYRASDPVIKAEYIRGQRLVHLYNQTTIDELDKRFSIMQELFEKIGPGATIMPIFMCDFGSNIRAGRNLFVNFNCVFLDCNVIDIGDDVQIGPAVQIYTATHPIDPVVRLSGVESALPVRIGNNVWIGGSAVILPGVTIGDNAVVGAGSIVTRDVAEGEVVVGNPARPIKR